MHLESGVPQFVDKTHVVLFGDFGESVDRAKLRTPTLFLTLTNLYRSGPYGAYDRKVESVSVHPHIF